MAWNENLKDIITLVIAAYGAALSTFNFTRSVIIDRRSISVRATSKLDRLADKTALYVEAVNRGKRTVVIDHFEVRLPNRGKIVIPSDDVPRRLDDGGSVRVKVYNSKLVDELRGMGYSGRLRARTACVDSTGRTFLGTKLTYNVSARPSDK